MPIEEYAKIISNEEIQIVKPMLSSINLQSEQHPKIKYEIKLNIPIK